MMILTRIKEATEEFLCRLGRPGGATARPRNFEQQLYKACVREGDLAFDVGANEGGVSIFLSRLAGPQGKVVAFEPVWPVYERLCRNVQHAPFLRAPVVTVPCGLAEAEKTGSVQVPDGDFGTASLASAEKWGRLRRSSTMVSYECSFVTLDGFIRARRPGTPQFVKIDVEGAELLVLRGGQHLLSGEHRPLMLIEVFAPWERAFDYGPWEVLWLLKSYGYGFFFACPEGLIEHVPTEGQPFPAPYVHGYNVVAFCRDEHGERVESLERLRAGKGSGILPMTPPPEPNVIG